MGLATTSWPTDYHAYVFGDGTLVGDFEHMYRYAAGVPWEQDTRCELWSTQVGLLMVRAHAPYGSILEVGCGLGYIAAKLEPFARGGRAAIEAFDIAPTAIRKARRLHPGITFYVDDITQATFRPRRRCELVVVKDLFWYVTGALETALRNMMACVQDGGWLYVCQSFPALDQPFVGREVLPDPEALVKRLRPYVPRYKVTLYDATFPDAGPMLHFFGRNPACTSSA